jgi:ribosome-associated heat shock protein Hsp15
MRVDLFLHRIRMLKSRTLAQGLIDVGRVRIDGRQVTKPSEPVHIGSVIAFPLQDRVRIIRVLSLPERRGPASEARLHYEEIADPIDAAPDAS